MSRTWSILIDPLSPGSTRSTSGCTPRAIRASQGDEIQLPDGVVLNAEQIEKLGLANRVVDDANLENETMSFAKKLAAGPRVAWWHVKKNMKVAEEGSLSEALDSEAARMIRTGETEDHKEAARAFVEKRAPVFKGY